MSAHVPEQLRSFERELAADPALVACILSELPAIPRVKEHIIRTSPENVDRAIARALARSSQLCELTKVEIVDYGNNAH